MGKATKEEVMGSLHVAVSNRLSKEILNDESDPRYVGMAIKFLSDNKVTMLAELDNELGELDKHLQARRKRFKGTNVTEFATKAAIAMGEE
jgi:hypothetical protein